MNTPPGTTLPALQALTILWNNSTASLFFFFPKNTFEHAFCARYRPGETAMNETDKI